MLRTLLVLAAVVLALIMTSGTGMALASPWHPGVHWLIDGEV